MTKSGTPLDLKSAAPCLTGYDLKGPRDMLPPGDSVQLPPGDPVQNDEGLRQSVSIGLFLPAHRTFWRYRMAPLALLERCVMTFISVGLVGLSFRKVPR